MSEGLQAILNDDGVFEEYDDTYDLIIHCKSKEEQEMAIQALKQEPCDKYIKEIDHLRKYICKLETQIVEQEPKTVLYSGDGYADGYMVYDMAECPNCGYEYEDGDKDWGLPFCPNCGQSLNWENEE